MRQAQPKTWYQVQLDKTGYANRFLFDLDFVDLIRQVVIPREVDGSIIVAGHEHPINSFAITIVETTAPVGDELREWQPRPGHESDALAKVDFVKSRHLFARERDVTNLLLHDFRQAMDWGVMPLLLRLLKEGKLDESSASQVSSSDLKEQIAALAGAFAGNFAKYYSM